MALPRKCTATKAGLLPALLFVCTVAAADPVGTVSELNGSLLVKGVSGVIKVLALNSPLEQGDTGHDPDTRQTPAVEKAQLHVVFHPLNTSRTWPSDRSSSSVEG